VKQKAQIIQNTVNFARAFGVECPKVACLAAIELINPEMACTLDASILSQMNRRGQIKNCVVDGPFALDNAISETAAQIKGVLSPVAGKADILLVPHIDAGNILAKSIIYFSKNNETAGIIIGATAPVILTSRADPSRAKLLSIAAAVLMAHRM
jgi:phosphate butyryltransferase